MSKTIKDISPLGFPWQTIDPFLFCAYHRDEYPKGNSSLGIDNSELGGRNIGQDFVVKDRFRMYHGSKIPGFPYHPHRGFETITINKEGYVDHTDSLGAAGRFGAGDVQWMTAGSGVQHSEMFPMVHEDRENPLEIFQIWLNLPAKSKYVAPHFKMLWKEKIPEVTQTDSNNKQSTVEVIAGNYGDVKALDPTPDSWAANPANLVSVLTVKMQAGATWSMPATDPTVARALYFYKGESLFIEEKEIAADSRVVVDAGSETKITNGNQEGFLLILQGRPINEPVVKYGPYVMNTEEEIRQTMRDYSKTQFGGWPWPNREEVHPREKGRFALHANGEEEIPG